MRFVIVSITVLAVVLGLVFLATNPETNPNSSSSRPVAPSAPADDSALGNLK